MGASQTTGSVWSSSSLFMPAALQVPALAQQQLDGMKDCKTFTGLPSAAAMMMPEPATASDPPAGTFPHQLGMKGLVEKVCRPACTSAVRRNSPFVTAS